MPYEKQIDIDVALSRAMQTFWSQGYDSTSMHDLVKSTGINRSNLYDTFGDKHSVFLAALKHYDEKERKEVLSSAVSRDRTPCEIIQALFDGVVSGSLNDTSRFDHSPVSTALELAPLDDDAEPIVMSGFMEIEDFFKTTIRKGQQMGEVREDIDAGEVAGMLLAAMVGLRIIALGRPESAVLHSIAGQALALIE